MGAEKTNKSRNNNSKRNSNRRRNNNRRRNSSSSDGNGYGNWSKRISRSSSALQTAETKQAEEQ